MQKIISLFKRNYDGDRLVRDEVVEGAEWVINGQGYATRKWDGTCCMVREGVLYKRYDAKVGRTPPVGFEPAQDTSLHCVTCSCDPVTGHWPGWIKVGDGPEDRWHREAWDRSGPGYYSDGTYELIGPKVQGNPEHFEYHALIPHGAHVLAGVPRDFDGIKAYLASQDIEGIVWHHLDGRMVKVKKRDFGIKRAT